MKKTKPASTPEGFLDDFLSVAIGVADIAVKVLPLILAAADSRVQTSGGYALGNMSFVPHSGGALFAINDGDIETNLAFSKVPTASSAVSETYLNIPPSSGVEISQDFQEFDVGLASISPVTGPETPANGIRKAISFSIAYLTVATSFRISGPLTGVFDRTASGYKFRLGFDKPLTEVNGEVSATSGGSSVSAKFSGKSSSQKSGRGAGVFFLDVAFPPGTDLEPVITQATVYVDMPAGTFEALAAKSRKKVRSMVELGLRRPRGRR